MAITFAVLQYRHPKKTDTSTGSPPGSVLPSPDSSDPAAFHNRDTTQCHDYPCNGCRGYQELENGRRLSCHLSHSANHGPALRLPDIRTFGWTIQYVTSISCST